MTTNSIVTIIETAPPNISAVLKLWVEDPVLREKYREVVEKHNADITANLRPNAGFDLFVPEEVVMDIQHYPAVFINHGVKAQMYNEKIHTNIVNIKIQSPTGFYIYPRSSISKTPLMLANHVGVIDSGYTGYLIGAFRFLSFQTNEVVYRVEKDARLLQIVHPSLIPFRVELLENEAELDLGTTRGEGGFGSTGV